MGKHRYQELKNVLFSMLRPAFRTTGRKPGLVMIWNIDLRSMNSFPHYILNGR
jgi:hypothetical protein